MDEVESVPADRARRHVLNEEFGRTAGAFAERTQGRFDHMDVVGFARPDRSAHVLEVGAGTGNFLALFAERAGRLVAADITLGMLAEGRRRHPEVDSVAADGARLPFAAATFDLVTTAQTLHHVVEPVPFLSEMRRVVRPGGRALIVDQVAPESYEQALFMNELERLRDPSHAASRPASAMRIAVQTAGLQIDDERIVSDQSRISKWMWAKEFPAERIEVVREFIERFGHETGMEWAKDGEDYTFTRRRMMILASR